MPRYFFDTEDNGVLSLDETGVDISKLSDVRDQAISCLPEIARERLPNGPTHMFRVLVRDESGAYLFAASLELKSGWLDKGG